MKGRDSVRSQFSKIHPEEIVYANDAVKDGASTNYAGSPVKDRDSIRTTFIPVQELP